MTEQERPKITEHEALGSAFRKTMLAHHAGNTFEAERVRLAVAEKLADRRNATRTVEELTEEAVTEIEARKAGAREASKRGIEMPQANPTHYVDPIDGTLVPFAPSTEPLSRGMQPQPR